MSYVTCRCNRVLSLPEDLDEAGRCWRCDPGPVRCIPEPPPTDVALRAQRLNPVYQRDRLAEALRDLGQDDFVQDVLEGRDDA